MIFVMLNQMLTTTLGFMILSLSVPSCPTMLKAMSLGRKWAYQDIAQLEGKLDFKKLDLEQTRFERLWLREILLFRKRVAK